MTNYKSMRVSWKETAHGVLLLFVTLILAACATPARREQMTIAAPTTSHSAPVALNQAVALGPVSGGKQTNPLWVSNISSEDFEAALRSSLQSAQLLVPVGKDCRVKLTAQLLSLAQPALGLDMTVTASVLYTLVDCKTQKEVWVQTITLPYTAAFTDSLYGVERLKLANEGAARVNIQKLVEMLATYQHN